jgi:uncharacterized repeat protein (TIGR03803 family)
MRRNHLHTITVVPMILAIALALTPFGWAATETTLYTFKDIADGEQPIAGVISVNGKLYGTTLNGGTYDLGTVFELKHTKSGWVKNTIHEFTGQIDGDNPVAGLVADKAGNLYGAANDGTFYAGVVFEMSHSPRGVWRFLVIHIFTGGSDGGGPESSLILDDAGNLYGTGAGGGGSSQCRGGCGTVFKLSPSGSGWTLTTLHNFHVLDGSFPASPLYRDNKGDLYGTTETGGIRGCKANGCGTVFELSPSGSGWSFAVIHRFNGADGINPLGPLLMDEAGSLYGTTTGGGNAGKGVVYKLAPHKRRWEETMLHQFGYDGDAQSPVGGVVFDAKQRLYGTSIEGGAFGDGAVFQLTHSHKGWTESVPFSFNGSDGFLPGAAFIRGKGNVLISTTEAGGDGTCDSGCGVVFEFAP